MKNLKREEAIPLMNQWGKDKIPFFFLTDFVGNSSCLLPLDQAKEKGLLFDINGFRNFIPPPLAKKEISLEKFPISPSRYKTAFQQVIREIEWGNSYLLNLSFATPIRINVGLEEVFYRSQAPYKVFLKDHFLCFSPEIFVQIKDGAVASFPMKGTISALLENAENRILNDPKEMAEHHTIVDLIRNDLNMIAKKVRVERFRYIDEIQTHSDPLLQVSSEIRGELDAGYLHHLGDMLFQLLPAGSISGAPKKKTLEIIQKAEPEPRGFYTGVAGYFDGAQLDCGVMIRFIEQRKKGLYFRSGGGITFQSDLESEYQEMLDKIYIPIKSES